MRWDHLNDSLDGAAKFLPVIYKLIDLTSGDVIDWNIKMLHSGIYATLAQEHKLYFDDKPISISIIRRPEKDFKFAVQVTNRVPLADGGAWFDQILFIVDSQPVVKDLIREIERAMLRAFAKKLTYLGAQGDMASTEEEAYRSADELLKQLSNLKQ